MIRSTSAFSVAFLLNAVPLYAEAVTSAGQLKDLAPAASYYQPVQSLIERWGAVDTLELELAAADGGGKGGQLYWPAVPLTNRQLAVSLDAVLGQCAQLLSAAEASGLEQIEEARRAGKLQPLMVELLEQSHRNAVEGLVNFTHPAYKGLNPAGIAGLKTPVPERTAMLRLLGKYETGAALLNADRSYNGAAQVREAALVDLLEHIFRRQSVRQGGKRMAGGHVVAVAAPTVTRGRYAQLLDYFLSDFTERMDRAGVELGQQIAAASTAPMKPAAKPAPVKPAAPKPAPAAPAAPAGRKLNTQQIINALNAQPLRYEPSSPSIAPASTGTLANIAAHLRMLPSTAVVEISVHTDSNGDEKSNQRLTQGRADNVRKSLVALGVPAGMLQAKGYGSSKPVAPNTSDEGRKKNRRTEFNLRGM